MLRLREVDAQLGHRFLEGHIVHRFLFHTDEGLAHARAAQHRQYQEHRAHAVRIRHGVVAAQLGICCCVQPDTINIEVHRREIAVEPALHDRLGDGRAVRGTSIAIERHSGLFHGSSARTGFNRGNA